MGFRRSQLRARHNTTNHAGAIVPPAMQEAERMLKQNDPSRPAQPAPVMQRAAVPRMPTAEEIAAEVIRQQEESKVEEEFHALTPNEVVSAKKAEDTLDMEDFIELKTSELEKADTEDNTTSDELVKTLKLD